MSTDNPKFVSSSQFDSQLNHQQKRQEFLQLLASPEYAQARMWWDVLKDKGEFWIYGFRFDTQVQQLAQDTGEEIQGFAGISFTETKRNYTGDNYQYYDVHGTPEIFDTSRRNYIEKQGQPIFLYEKPQDEKLTNFSYEFRSVGIGDRSGGATTHFDFRLPPKEARQFIQEFSENPELLKKIFTYRYHSLDFDLPTSEVLHVVTNVEKLTKDGENVRFGQSKQQRKEHMKDSDKLKESLHVIEDQEKFLSENYHVVLFPIGNTQSQHTDTKIYTDRLHQLITTEKNKIRQVLEHVLVEESPLVEKILTKIQRILTKNLGRS